MTQYARPDSDISVDSWVQWGYNYWKWSANGNSTSNLYAQIDEASASDSDYAKYKSMGSETGQIYYKAGLSDIDEPSDLSTVSIRIRLQNSSVNCYVQLYDGTTEIKSFWTGTNASATDVDQSLTSTEAGNISDWSDLRLWFSCDDDTQYQTCYIYQAYLEAGDAAPAGTTVTPDAASFVTTASATVDAPITITPAAAVIECEDWIPKFIVGDKTVIRTPISQTWGVRKYYDSSYTYEGCDSQSASHYFGASRNYDDYWLRQNLTAWWFPSVDLPECYNVSNAVIIFKGTNTPYIGTNWDTNSPRVTIYGDDTDDATYTDLWSCTGYNSHTLTTANETWYPPKTPTSGAMQEQTTDDISSVVNEIRNRSGWDAGNNMQFFFENPLPRFSSGYTGWDVAPHINRNYGRVGPVLEITYDGSGTVKKTIGTSSTHGTSTPTSSSGSSTYTVGFDTAVTGVSVGDKVFFDDYSMGYMEQYVYRVDGVNSTTSFDLVFVSGGSSGDVTPYGNLYNEMFEQASGVFKSVYDYESPRAWAADLDDASVYCDGDNAVGEISVNEKFDEGVVFPASSSVALNSITLTVHSSVRHTGVANSGAGFKYTATSSSGGGANLSQVLALQNVDNTTIEWIEFDGSGVTGSSYCDNFVTDNGTGRNNNTVRNCVMHNLTLQAGGFAAYAIHLTTSNDAARDNETNAILNNIIYGVTSTSGSGGDAGGIYADAGKSANPIYVYNNTVHNITPRTTAYFARGINVTEHAIVKNNIVSDVTGSSTANCFTAVGSFNSSNDYNLSTDTTAPGSNSVTSATLADIYESVSGTINLHLKIDSPAIGAGYDLGTFPTGVNIDIDGRDRDDQGDTWDIGADQWVLNGQIINPTAAAFVAAVPNPTVSEELIVAPAAAVFVAAASGATPSFGSVSFSPSAASLVAQCPDPTVTIFQPTVSVTPAAAVIETAATCKVGVDVDVTPSVATIIVVGTFAGPGFTSVTVSPAAASFVADAVNPTASKDSFAYTPAVASFVAAGITPTVTTGSITFIPSLASVAAAAVSPTTTLGSIAYTPATASFVAAVITPTLVFGSSTATPGAAAIELTASYAGIELSSISVTPSVAACVAAAITPTVQLGSLSLGATAIFEAAAQSPTSTYSSVTVPPADAAVLVESRFGGIVAGGVIVIPDLRATVVTAVNTPTVAYGSQTVTPLVSSFVSDATFSTVVRGNLTVSPSASIVEISAVSPTIDMGLDITPPVAAAVYDVASFTLLVGKLSAYVGYTFSGLVDYEMDGLIDYDQIEPIDYQTTTSPIDYSTDGLLDYEYDN